MSYIELARKCGAILVETTNLDGSTYGVMIDAAQIKAFADAIRAEQKEKDAKICDSEGHEWSGVPAHSFFKCAEAIRSQT